METKLIEALASAGGVAILALLIFLMYRRDRKTSEDASRQLAERALLDRKFMEDRLTCITKDYNAASTRHTDALEKNSQVLSELITFLKMKNG